MNLSNSTKINNRLAILNNLRENGKMSRKDLAKLVGLTPAAITILTNEMIREGILRELGELEEKDKRAGRKKILLNINYNYKYVIGINIESQITNIAISNLNSDTIDAKSIDTYGDILPEEFLKYISKECIQMLWNNGITKQDIIGIGVGIIGQVDKDMGISKHAYGLWEREVSVKNILEKEIGIPVVLDNNVRALAIGEMDYGVGKNINNMIFIKHGPGIGSSIIINNHLYYGDNSKAGEIGHVVIDENGNKCRCGKRGCLETISSEKYIRNCIKKVFSKDKTPCLFEICNGDINNINPDNITKSVEKGDQEIKNIIYGVLDNISIVLCNAMTILDINKIVLYGDMFKKEIFYKYTVDSIKKIMGDNFDEVSACRSSLKDKANYIGALAIAIRKFFFNGEDIN